MSYQCLYTSSSTENMEVLTYFENNGKVHCYCDVTFPGKDFEHDCPVTRDVSATCTFVIIRCPLSHTLLE